MTCSTTAVNADVFFYAEMLELMFL